MIAGAADHPLYRHRRSPNPNPEAKADPHLGWNSGAFWPYRYGTTWGGWGWRNWNNWGNWNNWNNWGNWW